ncbi:hypothetical protein TNCV_4219131 [Trichonephila clavipes]|nr:hypothetical protein TNCV_4219131 [Trichonephila clavipes]
MKLALLTSLASVGNTTMVGFESGDTVERGCLTAALCTATLVLHRELWSGVQAPGWTKLTQPLITSVGRVPSLLGNSTLGVSSQIDLLIGNLLMHLSVQGHENCAGQ